MLIISGCGQPLSYQVPFLARLILVELVVGGSILSLTHICVFLSSDIQSAVDAHFGFFFDSRNHMATRQIWLCL